MATSHRRWPYSGTGRRRSAWKSNPCPSAANVQLFLQEKILPSEMTVFLSAQQITTSSATINCGQTRGTTAWVRYDRKAFPSRSKSGYWPLHRRICSRALGIRFMTMIRTTTGHGCLGSIYLNGTILGPARLLGSQQHLRVVLTKNYIALFFA